MALRSLLKKMALPVLLLVRRIIDSIGMVFVRRKYAFVADNMATAQITQALFLPEFERAYNRGIKAAGADINIRFRTHQAIWCADNALSVEGDFVELGTGRGFLFTAILEYLTNKHGSLGRSIYLFDTFLPVKPDADGNQKAAKPSNIVSAYADGAAGVIDNFAQWADVNITEGRLPESAKKYVKQRPKIAFLHVDLNHGPTEIDCINLLEPFLSDGAIILLDDFANAGRESQFDLHKAFFDERRLPILSTASGQGIVIYRS